MEGTGGAFGAGKAGGQFDPIAYIKKPQVILRLLSLVIAENNTFDLTTSICFGKDL